MLEVGGIDLGLRKVHVFCIHDDGHPVLWDIDLPKQPRRDIELKMIHREVKARFADETGPFFMEEPVVAGARNLRTSLGIAQTAGAVISALRSSVFFVPVASWKVATVGKGNAKKDQVSLWLSEQHASYYSFCARTNSPQDYADAACIALYGSDVLNRS